jgi:hypothetical protein
MVILELKTRIKHHSGHPVLSWEFAPRRTWVSRVTCCGTTTSDAWPLISENRREYEKTWQFLPEGFPTSNRSDIVLVRSRTISHTIEEVWKQRAREPRARHASSQSRMPHFSRAGDQSLATPHKDFNNWSHMMTGEDFWRTRSSWSRNYGTNSIYARERGGHRRILNSLIEMQISGERPAMLGAIMLIQQDQHAPEVPSEPDTQ